MTAMSWLLAFLSLVQAEAVTRECDLCVLLDVLALRPSDCLGTWLGWENLLCRLASFVDICRKEKIIHLCKLSSPQD